MTPSQRISQLFMVFLLSIDAITQLARLFNIVLHCSQGPLQELPHVLSQSMAHSPSDMRASSIQLEEELHYTRFAPIPCASNLSLQIPYKFYLTCKEQLHLWSRSLPSVTIQHPPHLYLHPLLNSPPQPWHLHWSGKWKPNLDKIKDLTVPLWVASFSRKEDAWLFRAPLNHTVGNIILSTIILCNM